MFSPTLANIGVDKKVPERRKYGMSHPNGFESEKEKDHDFQPTEKWHTTRPSAFKGKQNTSLKCYCWMTIPKRYVPKTPRTQSGQCQLLNNGLCHMNSIVLSMIL